MPIPMPKPPSQRRKQQLRRAVVQAARELLTQQPIFLDTETTGIDGQAEVVEIAIIDHEGEILLDSLVKPQSPIPWQAEQVHGISNEDVRHAPSFARLWPEISALMEQHPVVIYNSAFDLRLLAQSARRYGIVPQKPPAVHCAMLMYANFYGQWDKEREGFIWHRLWDAAVQSCLSLPSGLTPHRARADSEACRLLVQYLAQKYHRQVKKI